MLLRKLTFALLLGLFPTLLFAQKIERQDPMKMWPYTYEGRVLNKRALKEILMTEVSSVVEVQKTRTAKAFANVFGFAGGFLVGRQIGIGLNQRRNATETGKLVGYGGGGVLILVSLLLEDGTKKHLHRGVKRYNAAQEEAEQAALQRPVNVRFGTTANGVGVKLSF